jgi:hypothetical protein
VVHNRKVAAEAAPEVLDIEWRELQQECLTYIRNAAS